MKKIISSFLDSSVQKNIDYLRRIKALIFTSDKSTRTTTCKGAATCRVAIINGKVTKGVPLKHELKTLVYDWTSTLGTITVVVSTPANQDIDVCLLTNSLNSKAEKLWNPVKQRLMARCGDCHGQKLPKLDTLGLTRKKGLVSGTCNPFPYPKYDFFSLQTRVYVFDTSLRNLQWVTTNANDNLVTVQFCINTLIENYKSEDSLMNVLELDLRPLKSRKETSWESP